MGQQLAEGINFDSMNETDVREVIVRPWLHSLGYRQGTENDIVSEHSLRYPRLSLGRKKKTDPALAGRADYVCHVTSYGRWVVEVKAPSVHLTLDDAEQAHTYAAHPEVAALYFVVTNGREFRLHRTSHPQEPELSWGYSEIEQKMPVLQSILGPESIKALVTAIKPDIGVPLAIGHKSSMSLVGGFITYLDHQSDNPLLVFPDTMKGARATVVGETVSRTNEGLIRVRLTLAGPNTIWDLLNRLGGIDGYVFETADEFVSKDAERPTIFQGRTESILLAGTKIPPIPGHSNTEVTLPFDLRWSAFTEAAGYLSNGKFVGDFGIAYDALLDTPGNATRFEYGGYGVFEIVARP
jgi:hypothetical protein